MLYESATDKDILIPRHQRSTAASSIRLPEETYDHVTCQVRHFDSSGYSTSYTARPKRPVNSVRLCQSRSAPAAIAVQLRGRVGVDWLVPD